MENIDLIQWTRTQAVLEEYGAAVRDLYKMNLAEKDRFTREGTLAKSAEYHVTIGDDRFVVTLSLADYWKYVEEDTRPHWPPVSAIRRWVEIKPLIPQPGEDGRIPTAEQLAFLVSRKIAQEGTKGTHDLAEAVAQVNADYLEKIGEAIFADLGEAVDLIFTEFHTLGK